MRASSSTVKLWFNYLQLALDQGVPINWDFYRQWGNESELRTWSFNKWWKLRGEKLFNVESPTVAKVKLINKESDYITVVIPLNSPIEETKRSISELVLKSRKSRRLKKVGSLLPTGQVNYTTLIQYRRFLKIDFDPRNQGKTIQEKTDKLIEEYRKLLAVGLKRRTTLRSKGKAVVARRFSNRDPESLDKKRIGISPNKVSRWRLSGKHIILNVAEGFFPGSDYYGPKLEERLRERLKAIGLEDIGKVVVAKGGRKKSKRKKRSGIEDFRFPEISSVW
jgi:hypothetical protein